MMTRTSGSLVARISLREVSGFSSTVDAGRCQQRQRVVENAAFRQRQDQLRVGRQDLHVVHSACIHLTRTISAPTFDSLSSMRS